MDFWDVEYALIFKSASNTFSRVTDCDQLPGSLRWTDLPDPAGVRPVNSRLFINIENERDLCTTLKSMNHR